MNRVSLTSALALVVCIPVAAAQNEKAVGQWEPFEITMTAAK